jgi:hypothetical protein
MPWHKKDFSDLVPGTKNESLGYCRISELKEHTVIILFLRRKRERFPLFATSFERESNNASNSFDNRSPFLTVWMNFPERFRSVVYHFRPFATFLRPETFRNGQERWKF